MAKTSDGRPFRILTLIDEYTRECLAMLVDRSITSQGIIDQLFNLFILRGIPEHIRSDNGTEFTAREIRKWLSHLGVKTLFIEPGTPGRMAILNHSMESLGMSFSTERYLQR